MAMDCAGCLKQHRASFDMRRNKFIDCETKEDFYCWPQCLHPYTNQCLKEYLQIQINYINQITKHYCNKGKKLPKFNKAFKCNVYGCDKYMNELEMDKLVSKKLFNGKKSSDYLILNEYNEYKTLLSLENEGITQENNAFTCLICQDFKPKELVFFGIEINNNNSTQCSHELCRECAKKYCETVLNGTEYVDSQWPTCPDPQCKIKYDQVCVRNLFSEEKFDQLYSKYTEKNVAPKLIANNDDLKRCPNPACDYYAFLRDNNDRHAHIFDCYKCNKIFCMKCDNMELKTREEITSHNCDAFQKGKDVNKLDEQLEEYRAQVHAKKCPGCASVVEKRNGCM